MVFYFPLSRKEYNKEGHQRAIPYTLQPKNILSLSYLLHNLMSKELFGKVLKCKNKINKKEEENLTGTLEGDFSFTLSFFFTNRE